VPAIVLSLLNSTIDTKIHKTYKKDRLLEEIISPETFLWINRGLQGEEILQTPDNLMSNLSCPGKSLHPQTVNNEKTRSIFIYKERRQTI